MCHDNLLRTCASFGTRMEIWPTNSSRSGAIPMSLSQFLLCMPRLPCRARARDLRSALTVWRHFACMVTGLKFSAPKRYICQVAYMHACELSHVQACRTLSFCRCSQSATGVRAHWIPGSRNLFEFMQVDLVYMHIYIYICYSQSRPTQDLREEREHDTGGFMCMHIYIYTRR